MKEQCQAASVHHQHSPPQIHAKACTRCTMCGALGVTPWRQGPERADSSKCQGWCHLLPGARRSTAPASSRGSAG